MDDVGDFRGIEGSGRKRKEEDGVIIRWRKYYVRWGKEGYDRKCGKGGENDKIKGSRNIFSKEEKDWCEGKSYGEDWK